LWNCPLFSYQLPTKVKAVGVQEELWEIEELGDEFLHVGHVVLGG